MSTFKLSNNSMFIIINISTYYVAHIINIRIKSIELNSIEMAADLNSNETDSTSLHVTGSKQKLDLTKIVIIV